MHEAFIGLGSNLGNREKNIKSALRLLTDREEVRLLKRASLYVTEPVGASQPWFINTAVKVKTSHSAETLLDTCKKTERKLGRTPSYSRWGPRLIDLDLLIFEDKVLKEDDIKLPHPQLENRKFVLLPLLEIEPDLIHPELKIPLRSILNDKDDEEKVIKIQ